MRGAVWRVYGAEGREGGPWHAADPLPCCWLLQGSRRKFAHRADTGRTGQPHELHCIVSGKGGGDRSRLVGATIRVDASRMCGPYSWYQGWEGRRWRWLEVGLRLSHEYICCVWGAGRATDRAM